MSGWSALKYNRYTIDILRDIDLNDEKPEPSAAQPPLPFEREIAVRDLSFRFDDERGDKEVLHGLTLTIRKGEHVGIRGASGAGKTTLFNLLLGFYTPTGGEITIDGEPLTAANRRRWQNAVGYVSQHVFLLDGTLLENIALGEEEEKIDRRRAEESLRAARLEDFVQSLSAGIDTPIGEAGNKLSGGQRQRIGIARALYKQANILFFDEATSALDPQTTKAILRLLKNLNEKLGITVVIITHEMAVVKEICDRVAVMEHGRVVEQGEVFNVFADPRQEITRSFIHTTSNLRKIEELIEEDSPVVQLKPGELIVRLSYIQRNVSEPLISTVSRKFDITLNIIFSDIAIVQNAPIGGTVAIISGEREQITQAIAYLIEKNVGVEVIRDARVSE